MTASDRHATWQSRLCFSFLVLLCVGGVVLPTHVNAAIGQSGMFSRDCGGTVSAPARESGRTWLAGGVQAERSNRTSGPAVTRVALVQGENSSGAAAAPAANQASPSIAIDAEGQPFVAWQDFRRGQSDIYAASSPDGGATWSTAVRVNNDSGTAAQDQPSLAADADGVLFLAWQDFRRGQSDIYFARSQNGGATWSTAVRVNKDSGAAEQAHPSLVAGSNGALYLAWQDHRNGNADIYFSRSVDGGVHWSTNRKVNTTVNASSQIKPSITLPPNCQATIVWEDDRNGNPDIYSSITISNGVTWNANVKVNTGGGASSQTDPDVGVDEDNVLYAVWDDGRNGNADIYSASSTDGGSTWSANIKVNTNVDASNQTDPDLGARATGKVFVLWEDDSNGTKDVYSARSLDSGATWIDSVRVGYGASVTAETNPTIAVPEVGPIRAVWQGIDDQLTAVYSARSTNGLTWGTRVGVSGGAVTFSAPSSPAGIMGAVHIRSRLLYPRQIGRSAS